MNTEDEKICILEQSDNPEEEIVQSPMMTSPRERNIKINGVKRVRVANAHQNKGTSKETLNTTFKQEEARVFKHPP